MRWYDIWITVARQQRKLNLLSVTAVASADLIDIVERK